MTFSVAVHGERTEKERSPRAMFINVYWLKTLLYIYNIYIYQLNYVYKCGLSVAMVFELAFEPEQFQRPK